MINHATSPNCIGPTIRISREILCLPYAGFLMNVFGLKKFFSKEGCKNLAIGSLSSNWYPPLLTIVSVLTSYPYFFYDHG